MHRHMVRVGCVAFGCQSEFIRLTSVGRYLFLWNFVFSCCGSPLSREAEPPWSGQDQSRVEIAPRAFASTSPQLRG